MALNIASNYRTRRFMTQIPVKYPLSCGCAGPKYVSKCFAHQEEARDAHHEALTGDKLKAENARLRKELEAKQ